MIYRVCSRSTGSLQPGGGTFWTEEVHYTGTSWVEACIAYYAQEPHDFGGGPGNPARETIIEQMDPELASPESMPNMTKTSPEKPEVNPSVYVALALPKKVTAHLESGLHENMSQAAAAKLLASAIEASGAKAFLEGYFIQEDEGRPAQAWLYDFTGNLNPVSG